MSHPPEHQPAPDGSATDGAVIGERSPTDGSGDLGTAGAPGRSRGLDWRCAAGGTDGSGTTTGPSVSGGSGDGFAGTCDALAAAEAALAFLARADAASLPVAEQAACLRALGRVESAQVAAHASILGAFTAQAGYEDDGHGGPKAWLVWQARVTRGAAAGALGWSRRLAEHPAVAAALTAGEISESWARKLCEWSDRLPEH